MMPLYHLLLTHAPWLPVALKYYAAISTFSRVVLKPFSLRIQQRLVDKIGQSAADPDDARDWYAILHARWYRWTAFALDFAFSFKLPTYAHLETKPIA